MDDSDAQHKATYFERVFALAQEDNADLMSAGERLKTPVSLLERSAAAPRRELKGCRHRGAGRACTGSLRTCCEGR